MLHLLQQGTYSNLLLQQKGRTQFRKRTHPILISVMLKEFSEEEKWLRIIILLKVKTAKRKIEIV
jgi:hypothetical protein